MSKELKKQKLDEEDEGNESGFEVKVNEYGFQIEDKGQEITVKSGGYLISEIRPSSRAKFLSMLLTFGGILLAGFIFYFVSKTESDVWWQDILFYLLLFGGATKIYKWLRLFFLYGRKNTFKEYHGCCHKVIALLEKRLDPTIDNLERMPRIWGDCEIGDSIAQKFIITKEPPWMKLIEGAEVAQHYYWQLAQKSEKERV